MKTAIIGGGVLGLTLAHRLSKLGHQVEVMESAPRLGGLSCSHDYGPFVWDRFYHCILPQDASLLGLLDELKLTDELRWSTTKTGYYGRNTFFDMSGNADFLRFPLLSFLDKFRLGAAIVYATRFADPFKLYSTTAAEWLAKICGKRTYEVFWRPLLKAKLGTYHDKVAAVFIWATLTRLFGARSGGANKEKLGYVSGGYDRILRRLAEELATARGTLRTGTNVTRIRPAPSGDGRTGCSVSWREATGKEETRTFDQVFFTAPARVAREIVSPELLPVVAETERKYPTSAAYLGVACMVLALKKPLTPYYVLNIGDENVEMTGLIEMTNLVDRDSQTKGLSLAYLPRYMDSEDPLLAAPDGDLRKPLLERGLKRLFPSFSENDIVYEGIHRARLVQPLPLATGSTVRVEGIPTLSAPFQMLGTYMLQAATLNNNEVVGLVNSFCEQSRQALQARTEPAPVMSA